MLNETTLRQWAQEIGFTHVGTLNRAALQFRPEVREMCAADRCRSYAKRWCCPPACGTLEETVAKAAPFRSGLLLQSTGSLEDDFDIETMQKTEQQHKKRFLQLLKKIFEQDCDVLPMAAGACTLCKNCTYPDAPCRFPQFAVPSMEAYGLWVSKVCEDSSLPYTYGPRTITYTSCILFGRDDESEESDGENSKN